MVIQEARRRTFLRLSLSLWLLLGVLLPPGLPGGAAMAGRPSAHLAELNLAASSALKLPSPTAALDFTAVAAGALHTCALTVGGEVRCWGHNGSGELGDGTSAPHSTPVGVLGLSSGVRAIATGNYHTCALTSGGGVVCWGGNFSGQLGDGTNEYRNRPADVVGLGSGVTAIAAGERHTCALTDRGGMVCWGSNQHGQLGDGTTEDRDSPVDVVGLNRGVTAIATGDHHTVAVTTGRGVRSWGRNQYGQLGDATTEQRNAPVEVTGLTRGITDVAAGLHHTCGLTAAGGVVCWGRNWYGQLGDGTTEQREQPVDVVGLRSGIAAIAAGEAHTCGLSGGGVQCWGANWSGQLGDGTTKQRNRPVVAEGLSSGVAGITAGRDYTAVVMTEGGLKAWGYNGYAQLGDGTHTWRSVPVDVVGHRKRVAAITAGHGHACAVTTGGGARCWGSNRYGQLGDGTDALRSTPVNVAGLGSGLVAVGGGRNHTCARTSDSGVKCWGSNDYGQLGDGSVHHRRTPVDVVGLASGVTDVAAGGSHTCAVTAGGGVKCWGGNWHGELGDGTNDHRVTPTDVAGLASGVVSVVGGATHTCALMTGGGVKCWGLNELGQPGDGTNTSRSTPVDVVGLDGEVTSLAAGGDHTCAVMAGGGLKCWGDNGRRQLGDGTNDGRTAPVDVVGLPGGVAAVTAGNHHTCALTSSGGVRCWGNNVRGQLGDGTNLHRVSGVDVVGLPGAIAAIAAGADHTCALTARGGAVCWGMNEHGQLGDGARIQSTTPVDVLGRVMYLPIALG